VASMHMILLFVSFSMKSRFSESPKDGWSAIVGTCIQQHRRESCMPRSKCLQGGQMHRSLTLLVSRGPKLGENSKIQNVLKVGPVD
jgi:hypothetical protein